VARQNVVIVGAQLKPQVGAVFDGAAPVTPVKAAPTQQRGVPWSVVGDRRVWARACATRCCQADFEAVQLDYAFARQSLAATTAKSWYLAVETRRLVDIAEQDVQLYGGLLKLAR